MCPVFPHISSSPLTQIRGFHGTTAHLCEIGENKQRNDTITKYSYSSVQSATKITRKQQRGARFRHP